MNTFLLLLIGIAGKLLTATFTMNIQQLHHSDKSNLQKELIKISRNDFGDEKQLLSYTISELKEMFKDYSSFVFLDMIFEVLKNIIVYIVRLATASYDSFNIIHTRSNSRNRFADTAYAFSRVSRNQGYRSVANQMPRISSRKAPTQLSIKRSEFQTT